MTTTMTKNTSTSTGGAAIYVRVSSAAQEDNESLDTQEASCLRYAREHGLAVDPAHTYREVHTGVELWERPQLTRLREAIRRREVGSVVVHSIDRLARDPVHLGVLLSEAEYAGVTISFVTEPLDNSPEGQLIRFVRGYAAKVEHEKFRERSMRGRRAGAESGRMIPGARPRYGYQWRDEDKSGYVVDPVAAPIVQRIFREAAKGTSTRALAVALTNEGVPTPREVARWSHTTIRTILSDPIYTGQGESFRYVTHKPSGKRHYTVGERSTQERVVLPEGTVPALIDQETFAAVTARAALNKQRATRNAKNPEETLLRGGFVKCGYCGRSMRVTHAGKNRKPRYTCHAGNPQGVSTCTHHAIVADILDPIVWQHVETVLTQPEVIAREVERMRSADPTPDDLAAVERALAEVARKQANLTRALAFLDDPEASAPVTAELTSLANQKRRLEQERTQIKGRRIAWERAEQKLDDLTSWCRTVGERLGSLGWQEKRLALDALGVTVKVYRVDDAAHDRYEITAKLPLSGDANSGHNDFSFGACARE